MRKIRNRGRRERGQTLIIFSLAMPLFLAVIALVTDGSMLMVNRRSIQVAADAAALAVAQDLKSGATPAQLAAVANDYSQRNGGPGGLDACNGDSSKTNCFQTPYDDGKPGTDDSQLVEVRLTRGVSGFFTGAVGLRSLFHVSARAVAGTSFATTINVITGTTDPGSTGYQTIPGGTHTTTDPGTEVIGGVGFALSPSCTDAIVYQGAGTGTWDDVIKAGLPGSASALGAFATNGGLTLTGNKPKKIKTLYYNQSGCPKPSPDSGTTNCKAKAWGDATDSDNLCVQTLVNLNATGALPINFPLPPPTPPTPRSGTWAPATDYPSNCINLGNSGTITFSASSPPGPPGIYCVSGASTVLKVTGNGIDLTTGDGYTFFALGGAKINVASNTLKLKFYWPSACGPRPTSRPTTFNCFGRGISNYDPQTLLYATNATYDRTTCLNVAICLNGNSNELTGDVFAPKPDAFPPTPGPAQTGGTVAIEGGALSAGSGFFESWNLSIKGNTGSYSGTGPFIIPGAIHVTTDPDTVITSTYPGTTIPGSTNTITTDTNFDLDE
jgi:hypothetical protein